MPVLIKSKYDNNKIPIYKCDICDKQFRPHSSTWCKFLRGEQYSITCSRSCSAKTKLRQVSVECDNCGKIISRRKSHAERQKELGGHNFCCVQCEFQYKHKETYEMRVCEICSVEFECPKISTQRFCSPQCQSKWQSTQSGILNPRIKRFWVKCDYCYADILVPNWKLEINEHNFCNTECRQAWYAEVWSQRPEWKESRRDVALHMLAENKFNTVTTRPQVITNDILDKLAIEYVNEYPIKYYAIDNYLSKENLMIEVMGDYWHSNPNKFNLQTLSKIQTARIGKDKAKHSYVKNQYGIEILYLWEHDLINNPNLCELLIRLYIENPNNLISYHSFNYSIQNNILILNTKLIKPYQDLEIHERKIS